MKESHRKGVAKHPDPESCEGGRKTALEALTGAYVGWVLSFETGEQSGDKPTVSSLPEGNKAACASASASQPCGVRDPMHA
jgi:hypothetical protein